MAVPSAPNLDSFIKSSKTPPQTLATSQEVRDRKSIFVASAYKASSPSDARSIMKHVKNVVHAARPASHEIAAWRCMTLKEGKLGLDGPDDFEVQGGWEDDGEKYGGQRVLKVMQQEGVLDVIVIVSRWYGGIMLGPARFEHIETCAREVCRAFKLKQDMDECITVLTALDDELSKLREELARISSTLTPSKAHLPEQSTFKPEERKETKKPDYTALSDSLDIAKARRLITARENAIKSLRSILAKKQITK
ncbi:ribosomal protein S5 domain 2-like protein [Gloeophyllum trabeum ATCC 11539]|uniref:Ribosomal protein S5 domain 2-like protein n=1 Tax=Gloeophyllum trabeum (strain ATCC 11539 / FP-39264 / Madison 617) TaxID=670483 RepID=S7RL60_GLOTA|nr:ribosomal protein S5 domain 2-like protein [Gloeophyllum trabeum ATCC 11539]EPQ55105.1 ribosomal protein S5 domain 2-like protein [Gloeophyllum trabeum ATCC 11539]